MLRVNYNNPIGFAMVPTIGNPASLVKIDLCQANLKLWAEIQHVTNEKGEVNHLLCGFFTDNDHLKRCAKAYPHMLENCHYHFNAYYKNWTADTLRSLCRMGAEVSVYYEEPTK